MRGLSRTLHTALWLVLFLSAEFAMAQTGVTVKFYDGSEQQYAVTANGKLYFSGDNLLIKTTAAASDVSVPVSIIRKITFGSASLGTQQIVANERKLALYPNPATDNVRIKAPGTLQLDVKIYSLQGQVVHTGSYMTDADIPVSALAPGIYLVQANGSTFKFVKQ